MKKNLPAILFLAIVFSMFRAGTIFAVNAIPDPRVPCSDQGDGTRDPEFNSQRPYQASPCGSAIKAYYCNNDYLIEEEVSTKWNPKKCNDFICDVNPFIIGGPSGKNYLVTLSNAEIPILGNTQETANSHNPTDSYDDPKKMTEYLAWYLSGASQKAEYGLDTADKVVNFSGPVKKLTPQVIQELQRFAVLHDAGVLETYTDLDSVVARDPKYVVNPVTGEIHETFNHNQIAVCTKANALTKTVNGWLNILGSNMWVGSQIPIPCYEGVDNKAQGEKFRLVQWWEGKQSGYIDSFKVISGWNDNSVWSYRTPPFPWQFTKEIYYQRAYNEWRGLNCKIVFGKLVCIDLRIPGLVDINSNIWADLYQYIPLGDTVDKNAKHMVEGVQAHGQGGTVAQIIGYDPLLGGDEPVLFYPHTISTLQITNLLNKLHTPTGKDFRSSVAIPNDVDPDSCVFTEVRSNPGDDLTFDNSQPPSHLKVTHVKTEVSQIGCTNKGEINNWIGDCGDTVDPLSPIRKCHSYPSCDGSVAIVIPTTPRIPNIDQIWKSTVAGNNSVFRQIYPKIEEGAPVSCISNIPGTAPVTYSPDQETNLIKVSTAGPNTYSGGGKGASIVGQLFFPHLGSVYDYFLKGIQTALLPQGYGEPTPESGKYCAPVVPTDCSAGSVPDSALPAKYAGSFKTNYIDLANRWTADCPGSANNLADECYNYVVDTSQKAGVNPAFALTIWLNESGASNYCHGGPTTQDFGINLPALYKNMTGELAAFLNMAKTKLCAGVPGFPETMAGWLSRFQSSAGVCNPSDSTAMGYYVDVRDNTWTWVTGCAKNGKFGISWPTDMSCP